MRESNGHRRVDALEPPECSGRSKLKNSSLQSGHYMLSLAVTGERKNTRSEGTWDVVQLVDSTDALESITEIGSLKVGIWVWVGYVICERSGSSMHLEMA